MKPTQWFNYGCGSLLLFLLGCVEPYQPEVLKGGAGILVVDGYLNSGGDSSYIKLSRSQNLEDLTTPQPEPNAQVTIEEEQGIQSNLFQIKSGLYAASGLPVNPAKRYRLRIQTQSGNEYVSEYMAVKVSPPIDSVSWTAENDGLHLYVNTHDPLNNSRYYRWEIEETHEFTVPNPSGLEYIEAEDVVVPRTEEVYRCWSSNKPQKILLGTSTRLTQDVISQQPVNLVPPESSRLVVKYSLLVRQFALTKEAYDYWEQIRKNTENIGTLFDPQPTSVTGNLKNATNPAEPVLGFFSVQTVAEKRVFISRDQLPRWRIRSGYEDCKVDTIYTLKDLNGSLIVSNLLPSGYTISPPFCADCRTRGTNVKPTFWE